MTRQLELIDTLLSEGRDEFTFEDAKAHLGVSTEATANALTRLSKKGLVDKLARGQLRDPPVRNAGDVSGDGRPRLCRRGGVRRPGAPDCLPERPKRTRSAQPSGPDDLRRVHGTG